ncbi:MAG: response regulator [Comamonadaceae bacterium]|nr:MAG: response regulator [Comamonadaceae bacterium]
MLASVLLVLAPSAAQAATGAPLAKAGTLDLSGWDFERDGIVSLDGDWAFFWKRWLRPQDAQSVPGEWLDVPHEWNAVAGSSRGYASYRLHVACRQTAGLALALPMQHSAMALYVNGRLLASQGKPAQEASEYRPSATLQTVSLDGQACPLRIVAHVANFDLVRGGIVRSLQMGTQAQLAHRREQAIARSLLALGGVFLVGLLSVTFFLWRRQDRTPLYFGLFCLSFGIGMGLSGERALQVFFNPPGFEFHMKLLFINWFAGMALFPLFLRSLYPRELPLWALRAVLGFSLAGLLLALCTPVRIFAYSSFALQAGAAIVAVGMAGVLVLAWRHRQRGAPILLAGLAVLIAGVVHDVLSFRHLLATSLLPYGMFGFVLAPAVLLAQRFARALGSEELRTIEQRERADMMVRSTRAGVLDWDASSDELRYSERYLDMLGYPQGDPPPFLELLHPDDHDMVYGGFMSHLRDRSVRSGVQFNDSLDYRMRRSDGHYIWVHVEAMSVRGADGRTLRYICSFIDITAFREQEAALRAQVELTRTEQRRLDLVVRGSRVGIVDWDGITHATYYSPRFREIRGYAADADTSDWPDYFKVMIHPEDRERVVRRWVPFIKGKGPEGPFGEFYSPEEYRLSRQDGSYIWARVSGMAVRDEKGFVTRWIAAVLDITQLREQQALLEQQNEALKENARLREEVERISRHDIKTPLNSIVAIPRLLREERRLGPEADELLSIVERAGYRILSMVNLSLDLYKMEQGSYIFRPDAVDLADLVNKVVADVRMHAASKQVRLALDVHRAPYAWAEELLCYSLVANLLKNAVEASPEGAVVTVTAQAGPDTVLLHIHNRGVVPAAVRGSFFQKYATMGKASGTGLGTYSARLMARVQDGEVVMETSQAAGTTLTVTLRAAPAGQVPATVRHAEELRNTKPAPLGELPPMRVLLVDDDEYNLLIVRRFLPSPPFTVDTAINGKVALAVAELQWPDVIFMDLDMPVMGGLQAVQELRALQRATRAGPCTMVALSSHEDEATRRRSLAAGFNRYLTKPVTREAIHNVLLDLQGPTGQAQSVPAARDAGMSAPVVVDPDLEAVLADFIASRRQLLKGMEGALLAGDRNEVQRFAHQLAGGFGLYGFAWASEQSRWIEQNAVHAGQQPLQERVAQLREHLASVPVTFS